MKSLQRMLIIICCKLFILQYFLWNKASNIYFSIAIVHGFYNLINCWKCTNVNYIPVGYILLETVERCLNFLFCIYKIFELLLNKFIIIKENVCFIL